MIKIRRFKKSDLDSIVSIENQAFQTPWSGQSFLDCSRWENFWFYVAEEKKKVVGYFVAQVVQDEGELHNIAVDPGFQKKGIGFALVQYFLKAAKKVGVAHVFLMARASNDAAIHLYQKMGFVFVDKRPHYYEDTGEEALIFFKRLLDI